MPRGISLCYICIAFGLGVFLALTLSQKRTLRRKQCYLAPETDDALRSYIRLKYEEKHLVHPISNNSNGSLNIEDILEEIRSQIRHELKSYNFSYSGVHKLEDLLIESGGQPVRSVVVTTWRSGSSFTGELLNSMPSSYFIAEPLIQYADRQIRKPPLLDRAQSILNRVLNCNYSDMEDYFENGKTHFYQFSRNKRLLKYCIKNEELCFNADFTSKFCKLFPFQIAKIVRLRLRLIEFLLEDKRLNVKLVLLIRDPRGVMQSRRHVDFCQVSDCTRPELLCADMISDYLTAGKILQKYPNRLTVIRFEDLVLNLNVTAPSLLKFLRLQVTKPVEEFMQTHTEVKISNDFSTFRVSRDVPFKWKKKLNFNYVEEIQEACGKAMELWGYQLAHNATHMASDDFYPLLPYELDIE